MKLVFIGDVLPEDIFMKVSKVAPSTNNLQLRLISYLQNNCKCDLIFLSLNYNIHLLDPESKVVNSRILKFSNNIEISTIKYINLKYIKSLSSSFFLYKKLKKIVKESKKTKEKILYFVFNPYYQKSLPAYFSKSKYTSQIALLAEGIDIRYISKTKKRFFNYFINKLNIYLLNKNKYIFTYSLNTTDKYAPRVKSIGMLHSIGNDVTTKTDDIKSFNSKVILYTGMLDECYGINLIISMMEFMPADYKLILCGYANDEMLIKINSAVKNDDRIEYLGLLSINRVRELQKLASALLLIRISDTIRNNYLATYAQPSKLPEYLISGTPIVATKIPAIPDEFDEYLNYTSVEIKDIANKLIEVIEDTSDYFYNKALKGRQFALDNCTDNVQYSKIVEIINTYEI